MRLKSEQRGRMRSLLMKIKTHFTPRQQGKKHQENNMADPQNIESADRLASIMREHRSNSLNDKKETALT